MYDRAPESGGTREPWIVMHRCAVFRECAEVVEHRAIEGYALNDALAHANIFDSKVS
jgi:hypothetical protein